jgi:hypothetical protein
MSPPLPNKRQSDLSQARMVRYTIPAATGGTAQVVEKPFKTVSDALAFLDAARRTSTVISFDWLVLGARGDWVHSRAAEVEYRALVSNDTPSLAASSGGGQTAKLAAASTSTGTPAGAGASPGKPMPPL